ncbi:MAG TPA: helix-turn-helix domain-containing protein [Candidatus Limnocylindrales bacterium]|jgi:excisionase family DNA binding protein|nr:helix-turn-helix domain-containing protein [Candidatus Limnocylindrales bacterium]
MPDMTVKDAAVAAGVSERTIRRWIREGRLAGCYKVGGRVRIPERAIREAAEPYGEQEERPPVTDDISMLDSPARARAFQLRRARLAFEEIDPIVAAMKPPAGPDDTAVAYIREWRDAPPRWERDDR